MIEQTLGLPIDIHGGGNDLIFPHHENEMAQGLCADHADAYANYWLHNGFLNIGSEKMSKSLGNVVLVHDLVTRVRGEAIRWALLAGHYRQPLAWTDETARAGDQARSTGSMARCSGPPTSTPLATEPGVAFLDGAGGRPQHAAGLSPSCIALAGQLETATGADRAAAKGELLASGHLIGFLDADPESWFQGGADPALKARIDALIAERVDRARGQGLGRPPTASAPSSRR